MGVKGKVEVELEIKSCGDLYHEIFKSKPHHVPNITPDRMHACNYDDSTYGQPGSEARWEYTLGGKKCYVKTIVEADEANQTVKFTYTEGDVFDEFKSLVGILQVIPKGETSTVKWTAVFEKISDDGPYPTHITDFWIAMTRDIEAHHLNN
ncbi:hypothetical protein vseg_004737 [Gypsophila vaccaria]